MDARLVRPGSRVVLLHGRTTGGVFGEQAMVELPDEAYLRELGDLDLGNVEAILAFVNAWGWVGDPGFHIEDEDVDDALWSEESFPGPRPEACFSALEAVAADVRVGLGVAEDLVEAGYFRRRPGMGLRHLDEFVLYASLLRDFTRTWQAVSESLSWERVLGDWETPSDWVRVFGATTQQDEKTERCVEFMCAVLNQALAAFSVHLTTHTVAPDGRQEPDWDASTWQALSLQLVNDVVDRVPYKVCANEACGRFFVRQRGTSKFGQGRTSGVMYCSNSCARAQAQREYRRRKKKEAGDEGTS